MFQNTVMVFLFLGLCSLHVQAGSTGTVVQKKIQVRKPASHLELSLVQVRQKMKTYRQELRALKSADLRMRRFDAILIELRDFMKEYRREQVSTDSKDFPSVQLYSFDLEGAIRAARSEGGSAQIAESYCSGETGIVAAFAPQATSIEDAELPSAAHDFLMVLLAACTD